MGCLRLLCEFVLAKVKPFFIFALVVCAASAGSARDVETQGDDCDEVKGQPVKVVIALSSSNEKELVLKVANDTAKPFTYRGYSVGMPIFLIDGCGIGWCGTGVRP